MSEAHITRSIMTWLQSRRGGVALKLHGSSYQRAGEPDIIYFERGRLFAFEVKTERGRPTRLQRHRLARWYEAGATAAVVRSLAEVQVLVTSAPDRSPRIE